MNTCNNFAGRVDHTIIDPVARHDTFEHVEKRTWMHTEQRRAPDSGLHKGSRRPKSVEGNSHRTPCMPPLSKMLIRNTTRQPAFSTDRQLVSHGRLVDRYHPSHLRDPRKICGLPPAADATERCEVIPDALVGCDVCLDDLLAC